MASLYCMLKHNIDINIIKPHPIVNTTIRATWSIVPAGISHPSPGITTGGREVTRGECDSGTSQ